MTARPLLVGLGWLDRPGGLERYLADLRAELADPPTVVLANAPALAPGVVVAGGPDDGLLRRLRGVRAAAHELAAQVDVVDLHFALTGIGALASRRVRRLPKVVHFQGPWADEGGERGRRRKRAVERLVYRGASRTVVLSAATARILVERYGGDPWRTEVIPPGVDLERFHVGDRVEARGHLGLAPEAVVVVAVRRLVERTGIDVLLEAWTAAAPDLPPAATLLVAGTGPARPALDAQLARLAPARPVRFLGEVDDTTLLRLYQAADLSVVPSRRLEGFGLVAIEALACGTPVLATRCGGLPEAVAGLAVPLVEPGDPDGLAQAIVELTTGERPPPATCRSHAERFAWPAIAARHRALYDDAAAGRSPAGRRVLLVDHSAARSGGEIAAARLVAALPDTNLHAVLFEAGPFESLLGGAGASAEVRPLGAAGRVDRHEAARPLSFVRHGTGVAVHALRLAARLRRLRPDVVHANSLKSGLVAGVAARLAGVPMVWHVRDLLVDTYLPPRSARLVRAAVRRLPVAVIAPSQAVMESLGPPGRRSVERTVIADPYVAPGLDIPRGDGPLEVVMVGRVARWKGQDVFLRAFAAAFPGGDAHATMIGAAVFGGDDLRFARELEALVTELDLGDRLTSLGAREDAERWLAAADVVVHASRSPEPFGQVIVEAMAAGAAVVATAGGGASELVDDGVDGLLVPPDDVDALAVALRRLAGDPDLRQRLGRAGRARVLERNDPARIGAEVAAVHQRAVERHR